MMKWDTRALLAMVATVGAFAYQGAMLLTVDNQPVADLQIPSWMSAVVMGVIGFYFGSKSANGGSN